MTNHKPIIIGTDHGIWRRVKMIPFQVKFEGKSADKQLPAKLESELSGILRWAVEGVQEWLVHGLDMPDSIKEATEAYRAEMDTLGLFIDESCVTGNLNYSVTVKQIYRDYKSWCDDSGLHALSKPNFGRQLTERGFEKYKGNGKWKWRGIGILAD
jgi:putative DNA primase/helicase